ncbi:putative polysaccharide biosynthesis protein [Bacillus pinisoli]|uniref:putative polysaccharide biosynthesis protein n=1 Tax=Bacillus pinisoli TaxID=2901866 RepID=UPI001FF3DB5C
MNVLTSHKQTFWHGAMLLTLAGLVSKVLSAIYRVPFQNIVGDIGFYIYQQVYPFYGIALALSLYGFPVVISKLLSEKKEKSTLTSQAIIVISFCSLFIIGFIIFFVLFQFSSQLANIMGDPYLHLPIELVAFTFLLVPFISVLRGYFQGHENMLPTALSQIAEQLIRVGTILILAYILVKSDFTLYEVGAGAVLGSLTGGFAAVAILLLFKKRITGGHFFQEYKGIFTLNNIKTFPFKLLLLNSVAICITGLTLVLMQLVDSLTLYNGLLISGSSAEEAKVMKGIFDRGQPLLQLGVVLSTSLSLSLVPMIAKAQTNNQSTLIVKHSRMAVKISIIVGAGATFGLIAIMEHTNKMLFRNMDGSFILSVLSISILLTSISLTGLAILQGLGYVSQSAWAVIAGVIMKWLFNSLLIPLYGSLGAAISTVLSVGVVAGVTGLFLYRAIQNQSIIQFYAFVKACIAGIIMVSLIKGYEWLFFSYLASNRISSTIFSLSSVIIGGIVFIVVLYFLRIFSKEELVEWPVIQKWVKK